MSADIFLNVSGTNTWYTPGTFDNIYVNTSGTNTWQIADAIWVNTSGTNIWEQGWPRLADPTIDSSGAVSDGDGDSNELTDECGCECSAAKKLTCVCIWWNVSDCVNANHHIHYQMNNNGGTWYTEADNLSCTTTLGAGWCDSTHDGSKESGCSTATRYARIRIEEDGTSSVLAEGATHGPYNPAGCAAA